MPLEITLETGKQLICVNYTSFCFIPYFTTTLVDNFNLFLLTWRYPCDGLLAYKYWADSILLSKCWSKKKKKKKTSVCSWCSVLKGHQSLREHFKATSFSIISCAIHFHLIYTWSSSVVSSAVKQIFYCCALVACSGGSAARQPTAASCEAINM